MALLLNRLSNIASIVKARISAGKESKFSLIACHTFK